ncbi:DNA-binding MarR family transcriptional regulator [Rhizobium aquaticum]|uniref:DNA-binding MarR family transcriptional regulator n=1 Tax=Rhizobium aquaticum TaxID=1549636 RepID=A0ABV2IYL8_9HYPH
MTHPCYCIALRKVSRRLTAVYDEAFAPLGVTVSQFSQLRNIKHKQPVSLTELADILELDRSTVGRNTKVLHRMGLVAMTPSPDDQRETMLTLTGEARALLKQAMPIWNDVQQRIEAKLEAAEFDRLIGALGDL